MAKVSTDSNGDLLWKWMQFLKASTKEEFEMLEETNPKIRKAVAVVREMSLDEQIREESEAREKAIRDHNSWLKNAQKRGFKKGIEQADQHYKIENFEKAKRVLSMGVSIEDVTNTFDLTVDEVLLLKK